jgi:hypothetical protein
MTCWASVVCIKWNMDLVDEWDVVYGHEAGIAEYIMGAMIALPRSFGRIDIKLR